MRIVNPTAVLGEEAACLFLAKKGYKILERNFRRGYGEIDIIALKDKTLVFIEVKTRTSNAFGTALEAITSWKLRKLVSTAQFYQLSHKNLADAMRIDAVAVTVFAGRVEDIEHIENISGL